MLKKLTRSNQRTNFAQDPKFQVLKLVPGSHEQNNKLCFYLSFIDKMIMLYHQKFLGIQEYPKAICQSNG